MLTMDSLLADSDAVLPSWVGRLDADVLIDDVGPATFERGAAYARQNRVESVSAGEHGSLILATVRGSGVKRYQTLVRRLSADDASPFEADDWTSHCTCPVGDDCKHAVAVLLTVGERLRGATRSEVSRPERPPVPSWETRLAGLVAQEPAADQPPSLGLMIEVLPAPSWPRAANGSALASSSARVRLRPVIPGRSGRWVKTGVSWGDVEHSYGHPRLTMRERDALVPLVSASRASRPAHLYGYGDTEVHLDDIGPIGWQLLDAVAQAGVPLVSTRPSVPVWLSDDPAEPVLDLTATQTSDVGLDDCEPPLDHGNGVLAHAGVRVSGQTYSVDGGLRLLGEPVHGVVVDGSDGVVLAPLKRPLDAATTSLLRGGVVHVPTADVPRFMAGYYPVLRERLVVGSSDDSVALPQIVPPRLALSVRLEPGHETVLHWRFVYQVDGSPVVVPLRGHTDVPRQPGAEQSLLIGPDVLDKVAGLRGLVGSRRGVVPDVRLHGLDTVTFVTDVLPVLLDDAGVLVDVEGSVPDYTESVAHPVISVSTGDPNGGDPTASDTGGSTDWFDLDITVDVDSDRVPLRDLLSALALGETHLILGSGTWFRLDRPEFETLSRLVREAQSLQESDSPTLQISRWQAGLWDELVELGVVGEQSERWSRCVSGLLNLAEVPQPDPPASLRAELRPYQREGYQWLALLWDHELGGVLADDMGLGKTLQTLAVLARAHENGSLRAGTSPALIVAPTSVVATWVSEAARFCPHLKVVAVTETSRRSGRSLDEVVRDADVVVTSYALARIEDEAYRSVQWSGLVLDEAQFVKNHRAKTYQAVRRIPAPFRLALTGTPLENTLMDLWSVLSIAAPGLFPSPQRFDETYRKPIEQGRSAEQLSTLQRRIRPLMLRRTKEQVAADLPPKIEQTLSVTLNPAHRRLYDKHLQRERMRVLGLIDDMDRNRIAIFRSLTTLRRLCLDASLVDDAGGANVRSSKLDVLVEQLDGVIAEGHRALVFSQFTGFLSVLRTRLDAQGVEYCYLDGRTKDRPSRIAEFTHGSAPLFLISLRAGGFGLNLTEADYVFVLDPWWNPAAEAQAIDRTHRIGQDKTVNVYRLVATDTIEEKVVALQQRKRDLFSRVMNDDAALGAQLTADDIRGLFES